MLAQLVALLQHRKFCCDIVLISVAQHLVMACSFYRSIFLCSLLEFCHNLAMSRHSSAEVVRFMSQPVCLMSRQFLNALQLEYLNSMSRQQNSLS